MKYAWKDLENKVKTMEVLSGSPEQFIPEGCILLGQIPNGIDPSDYSYLKDTFVEEVLAADEYWSKEGEVNSATQPMTSDLSWTYHAPVSYQAPASAYWSKEGEIDVMVDPQDETWTYHPPMEEIQEVPEFWSKDGENDIFVQPLIEDSSWTYHAAVSYAPAYYEISVDQSLKVTADKTVRITAAHAQMNADVYAEMENIFGTTNGESASAYERTWQVMKANPASFINVGIKDDSGVEFTTEQSVTDYADTKIAAVLAYGVWRMQRIEQFRSERASILAE